MERLSRVETSPCAVIIDGCSTGSFYAQRLPDQFRCVHIQSQIEPPVFFRRSFDPGFYIDNLKFDGNMTEFVERVRAYGPQFILAGSELGVDLAEELLTHFPHLPQNDTRVPQARRNKYLMSECVRRHGLDIIPQIQTNEADEAVHWSQQQNEWPVVVKDVLGSGSCGLRICRSAHEIRQAFGELIGSNNDLNVPIGKLLVQLYVRGDEYAVNTVSCGGRHYVTDVMKYTKGRLPNGRMAFLRDELQSYDWVSRLPGFFEYVFGVLDALGIRIGPAHTEIMYTERGPRLIECAARPSGGSISPRLMMKCLGHSQIDLTILALINPSKFYEYTADHYRLKSHLTWASLVARCSGKVVALNHLDQIQSLKSFDSFNGLLQLGDRAHETMDLDSVPGIVHLAHEDREQVDADYLQIRELDRRGIFVIEPDIVDSDALLRLRGSR